MPPLPDVKPEMKGPQFAAWLLFLVSFITGIFASWLACLIALAMGIIRKGGFPRMNMDYMKTVVMDENVQMLGFLAIASSAGSLSLICWAPIFLHAALVCVWITND